MTTISEGSRGIDVTKPFGIELYRYVCTFVSTIFYSMQAFFEIVSCCLCLNSFNSFGIVQNFFYKLNVELHFLSKRCSYDVRYVTIMYIPTIGDLFISHYQCNIIQFNGKHLASFRFKYISRAYLMNLAYSRNNYYVWSTWYFQVKSIHGTMCVVREKSVSISGLL